MWAGSCEGAVNPEQLVRQLIVRYGSIRAAGIAYNERFGYQNQHYAGKKWHGGNGARLMHRVLAGRAITPQSRDRLEVLLCG